MENKNIPYKIYLSEEQLPKAWYNVRADMKVKPAPLLNPGTLQPMTKEELGAVFCEELVDQELNDYDAYIPIPEEIQDYYKTYRPSPLVRAYNLEKKLGTPAKIYYKFEGNNTSGSHKLNSAIAQAYYAKKQGLKGVTTETGAGQWGTALSMACAYFDLDCKVFMVKVSYEQKPFRREVMRTYGASVTPSPSMETAVGRKILEAHPGTTGSLGCAISEAVEVATANPGLPVCVGQRAQSGAAASVRHRPGSKGCAGSVWHRAGHYHRLCRRRLQPGRIDLPIHGRKASGRAGLPDHCCGAGLLPQLYQRQIPL